MIYGEDAADSLARRPAARPEHLARVQALRDAGQLVIAGPLPAVDSPDPGPAGMAGGLIVAEFDSLDQARAWIDADPYVAQGIFARVTVCPFLPVFPT